MKRTTKQSLGILNLSLGILNFSSLKELLRSLKETGVNNIKGSFVLNKASIAGLEAHFNEAYELSYNYTFLVAQKG